MGVHRTLAHDVPRPTALLSDNPEITSYIIHRERARQDGRLSTRITWTPLCEISPFIICAVVKAEDPGFFQHGGVAWRHVFRAARDGVKGRGWRGASTITQQLARNLYLSPERSFQRKMREMALAIRLERNLSKARILELYLNCVEWGDGIWGIAAASDRYLQCPAGAVGVLGAVVLASLLPAPRRPLHGYNAQRAFKAQHGAILSLYASGVLSVNEMAEAHARVNRLFKMLHSGVPLSAALSRLDGPLTASDPDRPRLSVPEILRTGCGHEAAVHFMSTLRTLTTTRRKAKQWPAWWSVGARIETTRPVESAVAGDEGMNCD